ncbi:MAG: CheR family methyltransferase [Sulfurimonas sp.]|nr:CheR family methyltransferase [Sulfurimonas sp.]
MIESFDTQFNRHIVIGYPCTDADADTLALELSKGEKAYHIEFGSIYIINAKMLHLLYSRIYNNKQNIRLITHTNKLYRYLKKVGLKSSFISLIKDNIVEVQNVELILIGGSSGSSQKILAFIKKVNLDNLSLVIVQHVEMHKKGIFDEVLQNFTRHAVSYAQDGEKIKKGSIYIAPENKHLKVENGFFKLTNEEKYNLSRPSISLSYESFSNYFKDKLLLIQECGYGADGVDKIKQIKANNSLFILQDAGECEATPMLDAALKIAMHDYVLKQDEIIMYINFLNKNTSKEVWIEYLLYSIYERYTYDLRLYHRDTIVRRLDVFMIKHDIKNIKSAIGVILFNKVAFKSFFLEVSINVTEFFRKPKSFENILKIIDTGYKDAHHMKIWSAGCSSGEEVYTMAMSLESLGLLERSILYATDFNKVILEEAKNAIFPIESLAQAKTNAATLTLDINLDDYLIRNKHYFTINEKIRQKIHFFQHNLASDASFNEFDIIICKNVIIYFDAHLQEKVFQLFLRLLSLRRIFSPWR